MASATTSTIYITSARLARGYVTASVSSQTDTTATISWTIKCQQQSAALYGQEAYCYVNGSQVGFVDGYITSSSSSWKDVCSKSGTTTVNKTTASQNVPVQIKTRVCTVDGYGSVTTSYVTATCYVTVSAKTSYTVSYNANGGSGTPSNQTKWYGTALTLSTTTPTRTGYSFQGWGTSASDTSVDYAAGASYTSNAALALYAIWKADTYTVAYNANGGSGAPSSQTKTYGVDLTLSSTKPTRTNYNFLGWGTSASATTVAYAAGATYSANSAITLYAIWELAYWKPKITNLTATRCTLSGTADEFGTYAKIVFDWELCQLLGTNTTATIAISWSGGSTSATGSGTSGTVSKVVGSGALSIESSYTFTVKVTDNRDNTSSTVSISGSSFPIDIKAGGAGVTFGKPASEDGLHSAWDATFDKTLSVNGVATLESTLDVSGATTLGSTLDVDSTIHAADSISTANYVSLGSHNASGVFRSLALINKSNNTYFGHGSYTNSEGSTYYEGNTVGIQSKGNIYMTSPTAGLSARAYGVNKVLWSGAYYMNASQTVTLSEAVSAQPNGVVLLWSRYSGGQLDDGWSSFFVPKAMMPLYGGYYRLQCSVVSPWWIMSKVVTVQDTKIIGFAVNEGSQTNSPVTWNASNYVLRYVIGV